MDGLIQGSFHHKPSDLDYKVFTRDGAAWMSFSRTADKGEDSLSGERRLEYFIGSGHRGRTYLYSVDGLWFELPVNYYTRRSVWDMAPAFDHATAMPALPVDPNCLHCHATEVQPAMTTARNRYADAPFRQGGVGCNACHGDPSAHLAEHGQGAITNPDKLAAKQRDSACIECHLEGDAVVYRQGKSLAQFVPGEDLDSIAVYFVRASQQTGGARATSQYEALLHSACKRAAGDKLTCTTCHDPHEEPTEAERVQYFRGRCLACHNTPEMAQHHPEQADCAHCHMPTRDTVDISHEQVTDHDIEARPVDRSLHLTSLNDEVKLVPVGGGNAGDREYGLAYAQLAQRGDRHAARTALQLLMRYTQSRMPGAAPDVDVAVRLGYLWQVSGDTARARAAYAEALNANPYEPTALANLAVLDASGGQVQNSVRLLQRLVEADPSQTAAGLNLAFIECKLGEGDEARALLKRLSMFNPDDPQLREFLANGNYAGQNCALPENAPAR